MNKFVPNALNDLAPLPLSHISLIIRSLSNCLRPLLLIGRLLFLVTINQQVFVCLPLFNASLDNLAPVVYAVADLFPDYANLRKENLLLNLNIS